MGPVIYNFLYVKREAGPLRFSSVRGCHPDTQDSNRCVRGENSGSRHDMAIKGGSLETHVLENRAADWSDLCFLIVKEGSNCEASVGESGEYMRDVVRG